MQSIVINLENVFNSTKISLRSGRRSSSICTWRKPSTQLRLALRLRLLRVHCGGYVLPQVCVCARCWRAKCVYSSAKTRHRFRPLRTGPMIRCCYIMRETQTPLTTDKYLLCRKGTTPFTYTHTSLHIAWRAWYTRTYTTHSRPRNTSIKYRFSHPRGAARCANGFFAPVSHQQKNNRHHFNITFIYSSSI